LSGNKVGGSTFDSFLDDLGHYAVLFEVIKERADLV
jgi:hypothetical protein